MSTQLDKRKDLREGLHENLAYYVPHVNYTFLAVYNERLVSSGTGRIITKVSEKMKSVLASKPIVNYCYYIITVVNGINGEMPKNANVSHVPMFKFAPITSVAVESTSFLI